MAKAMSGARFGHRAKAPFRMMALAFPTSLVHIHFGLQQEETKVIKKSQK
jgi:hypothetical protein